MVEYFEKMNNVGIYTYNTKNGFLLGYIQNHNN